MTDSANEFGTLNLVTGVFTPIANQPVTIFGMGFAPNGALYAVDNGDTVGTAYQVDPLTGNLTSLGTFTPGIIGSTVGPDGLIYALSPDQSAMFFTVNPSGGATNTINGSLDFISDGLAAFNGGLFYTDIQFPNSDILTQIDPTTGTSTLIGSGLGYEVFAGTTVSSTIYGIGLDAEATPALLRITRAQARLPMWPALRE